MATKLEKRSSQKAGWICRGRSDRRGGWYWYTGAAQAPQAGVLVPITVTRGTVEALVTAQGKLEAKQYVDVGTQVSGQLKAIHVDIGDTVTKGQLLAEIDPRVYQAQVEAGEAKLNSLRAQLNQQKAEAVLAEQNLKRNQNLIAANAVSQQALQETESRPRWPKPKSIRSSRRSRKPSPISKPAAPILATPKSMRRWRAR